ncbi:cytochrome P450 [Aspergillus terricola var. indicus]
MLVPLFLAIPLACVGTLIFTTIRFRIDVHRHQTSKNVVPLKPYAVPLLGSSLDFTNSKIGQVWDSLIRDCNRWNLKSLSVLLAGVRTHILFTPNAVLSELKAKHLTRHKHARLLATNVLGMSREEAAKTFPDTPLPKTSVTLERVHSEFLLTSTPVTTLTNKFMECLYEAISGDSKIGTDDEIELYAWIKDKLFNASVSALFGSELLRMHPDLHKDFWIWEQNLLTLLFGTPRIFARQAYASRERLLAKLSKWLEHGYRHTATLDDAVAWEPYFGAKIIRKRHEYYNQQKLSLRSQAGKEMIFLAGILSNAIPTIGWLLVHIFSPTSSPDLFPRIEAEVKNAVRDDGSIDFPALLRAPFLNSAMNEVLRLYIDLMIIRQVDADSVLDSIPLRTGDQVIASSWMTHRHPDNFDSPNEFDPERFLRRDAESGELSCSTSGLGGKYFPFGGGHHMCPGRNFAKQEILGTVAVILLNFDVSFVSFIERDGDVVHRKGSDVKGFPKMVRALPGNQVMQLKGDMAVKITKKTPLSTVS